MRLLLDTHTFLGFVEDNERLSDKARTAIEMERGRVFVSAVTLWEIAIKSSIGKLTLKFPFNDLITDQLRRNVMELLPISTDHLTRLHSLPHHHQDPFDRLLAAQSLTDQLQFLSATRRLMTTAWSGFGSTSATPPDVLSFLPACFSPPRRAVAHLASSPHENHTNPRLPRSTSTSRDDLQMVGRKIRHRLR